MATASKTRLAPIKLFKLALNVAKSTPIAIIGGQTLRLLIKLQSCNNIVGSHVIAVKNDIRDNMDKVKKQAPNVPLGRAVIREYGENFKTNVSQKFWVETSTFQGLIGYG